MSMHCQGDKKWLLMHDAAEAYLSDVPRPIKPMLPEFRLIEDSVLAVIGGKYGIGEPDHESIKHADVVMLATEKRDVLLPCPDWPLILPDPLPFKITPWTWQVAEQLFLDRAKELEVTK
jgi:hypothetical protein